MFASIFSLVFADLVRAATPGVPEWDPQEFSWTDAVLGTAVVAGTQTLYEASRGITNLWQYSRRRTGTATSGAWKPARYLTVPIDAIADREKFRDFASRVNFPEGTGALTHEPWPMEHATEFDHWFADNFAALFRANTLCASTAPHENTRVAIMEILAVQLESENALRIASGLIEDLRVRMRERLTWWDPSAWDDTFRLAEPADRPRLAANAYAFVAQLCREAQVTWTDNGLRTHLPNLVRDVLAGLRVATTAGTGHTAIPKAADIMVFPSSADDYMMWRTSVKRTMDSYDIPADRIPEVINRILAQMQGAASAYAGSFDMVDFLSAPAAQAWGTAKVSFLSLLDSVFLSENYYDKVVSKWRGLRPGDWEYNRFIVEFEARGTDIINVGRILFPNSLLHPVSEEEKARQFLAVISSGTRQNLQQHFGTLGNQTYTDLKIAAGPRWVKGEKPRATATRKTSRKVSGLEALEEEVNAERLLAAATRSGTYTRPAACAEHKRFPSVSDYHMVVKIRKAAQDQDGTAWAKVAEVMGVCADCNHLINEAKFRSWKSSAGGNRQQASSSSGSSSSG